MPVEMFTDGLEPPPESVIWRYLERWKLEDLLKTGELHFCRADLMADGSEGLAPEDYVRVLNLNPLDLRDRQELNHSIGSDAQFREAFYLNCWYLFDSESCKMWKDYASDGVAICSRYELLKSALENCDGRPHLGLVRYGSEHLTGWNLHRFITTKKREYAHEKEVRAALWILDSLAGGNRHIDVNNKAHDRPLTPPPSDRVPDGVRRKIDIQALVTEIVVSPWIETSSIEQLVRSAGYTFPIRQSELARYKDLLPY